MSQLPDRPDLDQMREAADDRRPDLKVIAGLPGQAPGMTGEMYVPGESEESRARFRRSRRR
jgi:hypothetical protein